MGDEYYGSSGRFHTVKCVEEFPCFLWGEHCCGFIEDEDVSTAIQHLYNLNALLFAYGQLPDLCLRSPVEGRISWISLKLRLQ